MACGAIALLANRRARICNLTLLAAYCVVGAGWHHYRWSDMNADDLARTVTDTSTTRVDPRRGERGSRATTKRPGYGFDTGDHDKVTTRFVLDITSVCDGKSWHNASGRAIVVVEGDRSEIRRGRGRPDGRQISTLSPPLNPGEFDYRGFLQAQGIRLRIGVDDPESFWPDPGGTTAR